MSSTDSRKRATTDTGTTSIGRPNILFLLSDEHSFRFLGRIPEERGGEPVHTPAFDRLMDDGTTFENAYCAMPLCTPSRICLLSGREVVGCGAWNNNSILDPSIPTIPGILAENGYATCLIGKMHLGGNVQFAGFRHRPYGDLTGRTGHQWEPLDSREADNMRNRTAGAGVTGIPESMIQDSVVADETVAYLREHQSKSPEQPWFLCASFSRPHFPLTAPSRWIDYYKEKGITRPAVGATGDAYDHPMSRGMRAGFKADEIDDEEMMNARLAYFACVSYLDEVIGDLLLKLEHSGLLENTVIVYTTDHGEMAGEHGVWWKNGWYEACTRVPFIVSTPGQRRERDSGRRREGGPPQPVEGGGGRIAEASTQHFVQTPVSLLDLFPTFCSLAAIDKKKLPGGLDGRDLTPALNGDELEDVPVFCDALVPRWVEGTEFRMMRLGDYKYVRFRDAQALFFDLKNDPGEQRNLLARFEEQSEEVKRRAGEMEEIAEKSIDFDAVERSRISTVENLSKRYSLDLENEGTPNLFLMPNGKLVSADDALYNPTVVSEKPSRVFEDFPG